MRLARERPEIVVQSGHTFEVLDTCFSPDGRLVVTAGRDETVRLWDLRTGCELRALTGHSGPVYAVKFSPCGRLVASASFDRTARVWEAATGHVVHVLNFQTSVASVLFDSSGRTLTAATTVLRDNVVCRIYRVADGTIALSLDLKVASRRIAYAVDSDGSILATYGEEPDCIVLRNVVRATEIARIQVSRREPATEVLEIDTARALAFLAGGDALVLSGGNQPPEIVSIQGSRRILATARKIVGLEVQADGFVVAHATDAIEIWDRRAESLVRTLPCAPGESQGPLARDTATHLSPDRRLTLKGSGSAITIRDVESGREIYRLGSKLALPEFMGNAHRWFPLAVSPVYPLIAVAYPDNCVRLWDLRGGQGPYFLRAADSVEALAFKADGSILATGGYSVKLWDSRTRELLAEFPIERLAEHLVFSPSGRYLAVATTGPTGPIVVIDLNEGTATPIDTGFPECSVNGLAFEPEPGNLLAATDHGLVFFSLAPLQVVRREEGGWNAGIATDGRGSWAVALGPHKWKAGMALVADGRKVPAAIVSLWRFGVPRTLQGKSPFPAAVSFCRDGRWLAVGCGDGCVNLWDLDGPDEPLVFEAHPGGVTGVAWMSDDQFLVTTGMDSVVRLWRPGERHPVATMVALTDSDYVVATEDGSYTSTRGGLRGVAFRLGTRAVPFDQFDLALNRPDRVHAQLGYAYQEDIDRFAEARRRRLRRMGLAGDREVTDIELPSLEILSMPALVTSGRSLTIRVRATAASDPLDRAVVYVNDVPFPDRRGLALKGRPSSSDLDVAIPLSAGMNRVQLSVLSTAGVESLRETMLTSCTAEAPRPTLFVLAVGVSKYRRRDFDLHYAAKDAADLADTMARLPTRFASIRTRVLADGEASRAAIVGSRLFLEEAGVDDQVIVFFAGHGILDGRDYYFLPADFEPAALRSTGLHYDDIEALLDGLAARRRLVLLDTCHAGEADEDQPIAAVPDPLAAYVRSFRHLSLPLQHRVTRRAPSALADALSQLFGDLRRESGAFVIAAAGAAEYAIEGGAFRNGVFTHCVLEALHQRAVADAAALRVSGLHQHVLERVAALTGGRQRPIVRRENLVDDFEVI